jgi:hypothetical protein
MRFLFVIFLITGFSPMAYAMGPKTNLDESPNKHEIQLQPHKALYDINLVATRSGSQIINIKGQMFYEWEPTCDAYITDHRFRLHYEYSDNPGFLITSDFSTFESFEGDSFNFSSRRKRNQDLYEEFRGMANKSDKGGKVIYNIPEDESFELSKNAYFPMAHTLEMVRRAKAGEKFFNAVVFDGSDNEGPVEINSFIGKPVNVMAEIEPSDTLDMTLLNNDAWHVQMAVFPIGGDAPTSDYEMKMIFHENGVISDMLIDYDDFSVTQKLVALEAITGENPQSCQKPSSSSKIMN